MTITTSRVERVLWIACPTLMFGVMFGHMNGVVNTTLALIGVGTLAGILSASRPPFRQWPLVLPIVVWAAWSLASVGWSLYPRISLRAWFDEVLYPLVTFWGFWLFGSRVKRPEWPVLVVWAACVLLALLSAFYWGHLQPPTPNTFPIRFYNRVGHTSTLVVFAMPLFATLLLRARWRAIGAVGLVACGFVGLASLNRFFWPAAGATLVVAFYPLYRRRLGVSIVAIAILGATALGLLEYSARERDLSASTATASASSAARDITVAGQRVYVPGELNALGDTLSSDTRPKLWAFYTEQGKQHAWLGVGFGKPLPGHAYAADAPPLLLQIEPQALTHAHNLFLNTWLQTGYIGVALEALLLVSLAAAFWRLRRDVPAVSAAGLALVVGMIAKNTVDDFMWQTTMLAFWSFAGFLLGCGERDACMARVSQNADAR
ncbi:O-antigen ligase family protein [Burkholderia pseudomallei]|uniref:Membrane protein n=9 Tax=pseudomallei group TaxID=111527 RepID=Q63VX4_BURPS|nr:MULTISPECIES: O-antigen ligase family protein [pseudomallei group]AAU49495.1 membrane protein, putative [Burkholderia mallei ATCC 23344]ABM52682.1 putative membrane protein [Burkholderia mallei SAVP1]ABN02974.1 putative membrane protein [Burkholderia mallei NCTC 10229]ABN92243.1 putative membrane protein [Burkholderia pseudomallei 1106a]ABO05552.1 putative membrane protein [Burkholderia mallei NCTC 10247]